MLTTSLGVSTCTARGVSGPAHYVQEVVPEGTAWESIVLNGEINPSDQFFFIPTVKNLWKWLSEYLYTIYIATYIVAPLYRWPGWLSIGPMKLYISTLKFKILLDEKSVRYYTRKVHFSLVCLHLSQPAPSAYLVWKDYGTISELNEEDIWLDICQIAINCWYKVELSPNT